MSRVGRDDVETVRTDQVGVYAGAMQAYVANRAGQTYTATVRVVSDARFFVLRAEDFAWMMHTWFPMAIHLLEGLFLGMRTSAHIIGQRQQLLALGALSAGLTHELNNPAAAALRANAALRDSRGDATQARHAGKGGRRSLPPATWSTCRRKRSRRCPRRQADPDPGVRARGRAQRMARRRGPGRMGAGADLSWAPAPPRVPGGVADQAPSASSRAPRWLGVHAGDRAVDARDHRLGRSRVAGGRACCAVLEQDRAHHERVDIHAGLKSTLVMLAGKLRPRGRQGPPRPLAAEGPVYAGSRQNQVWTNLIDNAVQAMDGHGTLTVRTSMDGDRVRVEIGDTGPASPKAAPAHLRTVLHHQAGRPGHRARPGHLLPDRGRRHGGDLTVESQPGDTRFIVRLP